MRGIRPLLLGLALAVLSAAAPAPTAKPVLPFVHDDYPGALREARARKVPLFIDTSARW